MKEIYTYSDIKPTKKDLERLVNQGDKSGGKWYLDGKFVGISKTNAERTLQKKLFAEYVAAKKTSKGK